MKAIVVALVLLPFAAQAHDGVVHKDNAEASSHAAEGLPLPFDLGGAFVLTDQHGQTRTAADPDGHLQLLFFGYANCQEICSVALPQMAGIATDLVSDGVPITPVMITVDPTRDTPALMADVLQKLHPGFVGLTGDQAALAHAYTLFSIENELVFEDPASGPVYAHGSFLYLLDGQGKFLTVLPPILSDDRIKEIIKGYANGS
ncbi:MAG: SCO family protein [Paracoccaceae bacterium]